MSRNATPPTDRPAILKRWVSNQHPLRKSRSHTRHLFQCELGVTYRYSVRPSLIYMSVHHQGFPIRGEEEIPLLQRVVRKCGGTLILLYFLVYGILAPSYWPIVFSSLLLWTKPMYMRRFFDFGLASWMHTAAVSPGSAQDRATA